MIGQGNGAMPFPDVMQRSSSCIWRSGEVGGRDPESSKPTQVLLPGTTKRTKDDDTNHAAPNLPRRKTNEIDEYCIKVSVLVSPKLVGISNDSAERGIPYFNNLASEVITQLLLGYCFTYGIPIVLQMCEEPVSDHLQVNWSWIRFRFEWDLVIQLKSPILGAVLNVEPFTQEGSLWAAGIGFPARGRFHSVIGHL